MFALLLYWTWTSAAVPDVPGTACAEVSAMTAATPSVGAAWRARLAGNETFGAVAAASADRARLNGVAQFAATLDIKTRDCC